MGSYFDAFDTFCGTCALIKSNFPLQVPTGVKAPVKGPSRLAVTLAVKMAVQLVSNQALA